MSISLVRIVCDGAGQREETTSFTLAAELKLRVGLDGFCSCKARTGEHTCMQILPAHGQASSAALCLAELRELAKPSPRLVHFAFVVQPDDVKSLNACPLTSSPFEGNLPLYALSLGKCSKSSTGCCWARRHLRSILM